MEENFTERVLPIYPRMSRLVLADSLTTTATRYACGLLWASSSAAPVLLYHLLAVWPYANKPTSHSLVFLISKDAAFISSARRQTLVKTESNGIKLPKL